METRQVLLTLGALCLMVAFSAGTALVWSRLGPQGQLGVMVGVTALLLVGSAALRRLPATAEALGTVGLTGCAIDAIAVRTLHLSTAQAVPLHWYVTGAAIGVALVAAALCAAAPHLVGPRVVGPIALAVAWASLVAEPQVFADVDFALAAVTAAIAFGWPSSRRHSAAVRNGAFAATMFLATIASTITLDLHAVHAAEAFVATPAGVALLWAAAALYRDRSLSSAVMAPGLALGLFPTFVLAFADNDHARQIALVAIATVLVALAAELRLATPIVAGAALLGLIGVRVLGPQLALVPHWMVWAGAGTILLTLGATWEARVQDAQRLADRLRPRIAALR